MVAVVEDDDDVMVVELDLLDLLDAVVAEFGWSVREHDDPERRVEEVENAHAADCSKPPLEKQVAVRDWNHTHCPTSSTIERFFHFRNLHLVAVAVEVVEVEKAQLQTCSEAVAAVVAFVTAAQGQHRLVAKPVLVAAETMSWVVAAAAAAVKASHALYLHAAVVVADVVVTAAVVAAVSLSSSTFVVAVVAAAVAAAVGVAGHLRSQPCHYYYHYPRHPAHWPVSHPTLLVPHR